MLSLAVTTYLGIGFGLLGVVAAALQAWLWRYPMSPDPTGKDPNGVSTAPRTWTNVHRAVGYTFLAVYALLVAVMAPRLWNYSSIPATAWAHVVLGVLVGVVLAWKILVVRRFQALGNRLPWFGGLLLGFAVVLLALTVPNAYRFQREQMALSQPQGHEVVTKKCMSCHGANVVLKEGRTADGWRRTAEDMMDRATESGRVVISPEEAAAAAAYLSAIAPGTEGAPGDRHSEHEERDRGDRHRGDDD